MWKDKLSDFEWITTEAFLVYENYPLNLNFEIIPSISQTSFFDVSKKELLKIFLTSGKEWKKNSVFY